MKARVGIVVVPARVGHAPVELGVGRGARVVDPDLDLARAVVEGFAEEGLVRVRGGLAPVEFSVWLAAVGGAQGPVPGVVGHGVEFAVRGEGEDLAPGLGVVVVCHVGGGV